MSELEVGVETIDWAAACRGQDENCEDPWRLPRHHGKLVIVAVYGRNVEGFERKSNHMKGPNRNGGASQGC